MADSGVFERRTRGEARMVWAGSVALCGLGWLSSVWPVVPGVIFGALGAVCAVVALRRRAVRARVVAAVGEQARSDHAGPRHDGAIDGVGGVFSEVVTGSSFAVVDAQRDAA